jgi:hypothetical protein
MTPVDIAVFVFGLILIVVVATFIAAPLFGTPETAPAVEEPGERERWERQKRQALVAIKETELDYQMGKLSGEDLERMRARFEAQVYEAMVALGNAESDG